MFEFFLGWGALEYLGDQILGGDETQETQELSAQEYAELEEHINDPGWFGLSSASQEDRELYEQEKYKNHW